MGDNGARNFMRRDIRDLWGDKKVIAIFFHHSWKQEVPRYAEMQVNSTMFLVCFVCMLILHISKPTEYYYVNNPPDPTEGGPSDFKST